jgi:hypothetical protein
MWLRMMFRLQNTSLRSMIQPKRKGRHSLRSEYAVLLEVPRVRHSTIGGRVDGPRPHWLVRPMLMRHPGARLAGHCEWTLGVNVQEMRLGRAPDCSQQEPGMQEICGYLYDTIQCQRNATWKSSRLQSTRAWYARDMWLSVWCHTFINALPKHTDRTTDRSQVVEEHRAL